MDAPGGTGKTFVLQTLLDYSRAKGYVSLACASSGIAATLLTGGKTAHATFKLPLNVSGFDDVACSVSSQSDLANVLKMSKLIIWDECKMSTKSSLEAVNCLLKDLTGKQNSIMGGKTVVLAGDFRQTLPVVPKGTKADQIRVCLKSSHLWSRAKKFVLSENMRCAQFGTSGVKYASTLLDVGEDKDKSGVITVDELAHSVDSLDQLNTQVFPCLEQNYMKSAWIKERAILAPKNKQVDEINRSMLKTLPGDERSYTSIDTTVDPNESTLSHRSFEFLRPIRRSSPQAYFKSWCTYNATSKYQRT